MNLTKKNIQKTSGIHKEYKPGQLITINNHVFRIVRGICRKNCSTCWDSNCNIYLFCKELPLVLHLKPI